MTTPLGRPSLIHDGRRLRRMLRLVQNGAPRTVAARTVGLGVSTLMAWQSRARAADRMLEEGVEVRREERLFRDFIELCDRAEADWERRAAQAIFDLAVKRQQPSVLLEMLSRHPASRERWKPASAVELTGRNGGAIEIDRVDDMTDDELSARIARLERIAGERTTDG